MNQILHIFKKDTRRFWIEILLSVATAAALVCVIPMQWSGAPSAVWGADNSRMMSLALLARGLGALLVVSWLVLILRVVHEEALVGDGQFWTTRPYVWWKLLGAKLLFIGVFAILPLVAMQGMLLKLAGFNPFALIPALFFELLLIVGMLILPLMAIASVTADFTRMTLTVLGVLLGAGVLVAVVTMHLSFGMEGSLIAKLLFLSIGDPFLPNGVSITTGHHSQLPIALLLLVVCGVAIAVQYALRRTWMSRSILLSLPVALILLVLATAHGSGTGKPFTDPTYPAMAAGEKPPVQLTYMPDEKRPLDVSQHQNPVGMRVRIAVAGIANDSAVIGGPYPKVTLTGADGFSWSENAREFYPEKLAPTTRKTSVGFHVPRTVYDRLKTGPVTITLSFALTQLQATRSVRMAMPLDDVMVPGYGICRRPSLHHGLLLCRSALGEPPVTYVTADWSETPCPASENELGEVRGDPWEGMLNADPAEFGISPILSSGFAFMPDFNNTTGGKYLCSGSMITFTQYKLAGRMQMDLAIPNLTLPED